jgi:6-phosphogluconate dehydrogenase
MTTQLYDFGMIGLGVMGRNFLLNVADHGFSALGLDKDDEKARLLEQEGEGHIIKGATETTEFVALLKAPRVIMLLVPAGKVVDIVIEDLLPHLSEGDLIIDGGNSFFEDTNRREKYLNEQGIRFLGVGVSGGSKGARFGPSIMPGGDIAAYELVRPVFEAVAAKVGHEPCVVHLGSTSAGNYVKMVHNGIEYGMMQAIAEGFDVMRQSDFNLNLTEVAELYSHGSVIESRLVEWLKDGFEKYGEDLASITGSASASGEGLWTIETAKDMGIPVAVIEDSLRARELSQKNPSYQGQLISVMRNMFGGHSATK